MDFSAFVGLPYQKHGRGPDGYDCLGLFNLAFAAGTGIDLPSHADEVATAADRAETSAIVAGGLSDWSDVAFGQERAFDGAVMRLAGGFHIGLIVRRGLMLHMPRGKTSVIEPIARFGNVLIGIHRHRNLLGR